MIFISLVYASIGDLNINMNDEDGEYFNLILNIQEYYKIHTSIRYHRVLPFII